MLLDSSACMCVDSKASALPQPQSSLCSESRAQVTYPHVVCSAGKHEKEPFRYENVTLPKHVDWRLRDIVGPIKDQVRTAQPLLPFPVLTCKDQADLSCSAALRGMQRQW